MENETALLASTLLFAATTVIAPIVVAVKSNNDLKDKQDKYELEISELKNVRTNLINDHVKTQKAHEQYVSRLTEKHEHEIAQLKKKFSKYVPARGKGGKFVKKTEA